MALSGYVSCAESDHAIAMQADVGIDHNRLTDIVAGYQHVLLDVSRQLVAQLAESCDVVNPVASRPTGAESYELPGPGRRDPGLYEFF